MAIRAYNPKEVDFRKVCHPRGKTNDRCSEEQGQSYDYAPWNSTYDTDYTPKYKSIRKNNNRSLGGQSLPT